MGLREIAAAFALVQMAGGLFKTEPPVETSSAGGSEQTTNTQRKRKRITSTSETLEEKIARLPPPPSELIMQPPMDMETRFKGIRHLTTLATIKPSSEQVKDYFRKEEMIRYSVPDRAFPYTAVDGVKSMVTALVTESGEPTTRYRKHGLMKDERPKHATVISVVRDAVARLPGRMGTRSDICILVRDSQFVVDDICESKLIDLVSGALERLRRGNDPCLKFDRDRHLWLYLHGDRDRERDREGEGEKENHDAYATQEKLIENSIL